MLDYCKISILCGFCILTFTACQTRPKSGEAIPPATTISAPSAPAQEMAPTASFMPFVRTPSVIYFDPASRLVDVSETLEILSYEGAVFGWTIPIRAGHPEFVLTETIQQICQDGRKKTLTTHKTITKEMLAAQIYREFDETDCRGIYVYEIAFNKEAIMAFKLTIL